MPDIFTPWINAYAREPGRFLIMAVVLVGLQWWSSRLKISITDEMDRIWNASEAKLKTQNLLPKSWVYHLRMNPVVQRDSQVVTRHVLPNFQAFAFICFVIYFGATMINRVFFNIQGDIGWVCREKPVQYGIDPARPRLISVTDYKGLINLRPGETMLASGVGTMEREIATSLLPEFRTSELCQSMGVWLERGGRYLISFDSTDSFKDGDIDASAGYYAIEAGPVMMAAVPLRRELIRPWFRVVARIGGTGGEEVFLDPNARDNFRINDIFTATRDGELFLFVNDAVIGLPRLYGYFYTDNKGSARVTITRR